MADFALWVTAAEQALGWEPGTFMAAYSGNRQSANDLALEASPVGLPLVELLQEQGCWSGTATKLLDALENRVSQQTVRTKSWPKNARVMSGLLKRVAPNLRAAGWEVESHRKSTGNIWSFSRADEFAPQSVSQDGSVASSLPSAKRCNTQPDDAISPPNDANDANDANPRTSGETNTLNDKGWEEGEL
jgi:hypothetical protein